MRRVVVNTFATVILTFSIGMVMGAEVTIERYVLDGSLNNTSKSGGPPDTNENFSFVILPNGKNVGENFLRNTEEPVALTNMHAKVPHGLRDVRVSAWVKTEDSQGVIRQLFGTGMFNEQQEIPCGLTLSISDGRLNWEARGSNGRSLNIRGASRINDGVWHHVASVSQDTTMYWAIVALYIDGKLDASYIDYYSLMTPQKVQTDTGFGFKGQISLLELQNLEEGPQYFTGESDKARAIETDPLYAPSTIPFSELLAERPAVGTRSKGIASVETYGAIGNGLADDTDAILKAISALNPADGVDTLFFPKGIYKISQALRLPSGVDIVGLGATIQRGDGPAIELIGDVSDISFRYLSIYGGPPAAVYQHKGKASHIYFERCDISAPGDGKLPPNDANDYKGRTSDGVLFTDVSDSTFLGCTSSAGRAFVAVEGKISNLAVIRCMIQNPNNLTGFYFNTPDSGPALLLGNTVVCNKGYVLNSPAVQDLVVRGLSTEGLGVGLPKEALTGPIFDIRNGTRVHLELISLNPLQLGRPGYQHTTWEGPQLRINGQDNIVAGAIILSDAPGPTAGLIDASLESNDPNLVLWQIDFPQAKLNLTGDDGKQVVIASRFLDKEFPANVFRGGKSENLASRHLSISFNKNTEPVLWGPPKPRFTWGELGFKSVRDYGAKGDGKSDDAPAFKQAITRGDVVYVPAGTYRLGSPIATVKSIVGDGKERTFLVADENSEGIIQFTKTPPEVYPDINSVFADLTLRGGKFGVYIPIQTANWFVSRVRFENQQVAGFAGDSFDNGNVLVDCEFIGGQYGFVGGGWNHHFIDKTTLWRCNFEGQSENGIRIAAVDNTPGVFIYIHTMLRDCVVRNSGSSGIVMMGHDGRYNFLDHCLIENCGQRDGAPYVSFIRSGTAAMYHTRVVHTKGPQPTVLVSVDGHNYMRFMDVDIIGAEGKVAIRSGSTHAWLERVVTDGSLQTPKDARIVSTDTQTETSEDAILTNKGLWLVEESRFGITQKNE